MNRGDSGLGFPVSTYQGMPAGIVAKSGGEPGIGLIVSITGGAGTWSYTPTLNVKLSVSVAGGTGGVNSQCLAAGTTGDFYIRAGENVTIMSSTGASLTASAIETS